MSEINDQFIIQRETLTGIADAVRDMRLYDQAMLPADMPEEIRAIHTGMDMLTKVKIGQSAGAWERPEGWPDLDSIEIPDDFDGVYKVLAERGFKNFYGDKTVENASSKSAIMIAPSGFAINLIQHVK